MIRNQGGWKKILSAMHMFVDGIVLVVLFLLAAYGLYGVWDSHFLVNQGLSDHYEKYKPGEQTESFYELQAINTDVVGWLEVYGTNIDYPVVHGEDDWKYINTDAKGNYSLTGALFLSCQNKPDFSDFNNIVYGHNMTPKIMFGNIKDFRDSNFFNEHKYGELFDGKKRYGIYFFAMLNVDAYDKNIYNVVTNNKNTYMDYLLRHSINKREIDVHGDDRIILLSTCSTTETNGRDILVGKITDEMYPNTFIEEKSPFNILEGDFGNNKNLFKLIKAVIGIFLIAIFPVILYLVRRGKRRRK